MSKISPCLWFDQKAEEAVNFYLSVFKNGKILSRSYYSEIPPDEVPTPNWPPPGTVLTVEFELFGQTYTALNGGPEFIFSEAVSLMVDCKTQEELDYYWDALMADGGQPSQCGWLKDKFGFSWQVVPSVMAELMTSPDKAAQTRVMRAMLKMVKLDIAELEAAAKG
ncbi:MAG TPA: VOC family protein [Prosthecobacter sp.]